LHSTGYTLEKCMPEFTEQIYFLFGIHKQVYLEYLFLQLFKSKLATVAHIPCQLIFRVNGCWLLIKVCLEIRQ